MNSSLTMDPSLGYHNEITIESLSICNEISLVSLWLCFMERIVSVLWNLTSLPVVMLQILQNFTGLSFAAQNLIFRSLLFTIALRQYCYCRVTVIFNKKPAKISYTSPISRKIKEISLDKLVSLSCPSLKKGFICHPLLFDRNLHTIWTCIFADYIAVKKVQFERELISAPDGGIISLDWTKQPGQTSEGRAKLRTPQNPTVYLFICHGLTGGSHETYVQELADRVKRDYGYESIVMNFRGCSGTEVKTPQLYAGSYTGDVELSIRHIQKRDPTAVLIGVGFSLGSNVITKYSGQKGKNCPFIGMVSIGNPYDFLGISRAIHRTFIGTYFYSAALSRSLIRMFSKHINVFNNAEWLDLDEIMSSKTVQEFDAAATIKQFGYATVHEYYRFGSCAQDIPYIRVPALFLTALDDPISQSEVIPYIEFASNPFTVFIATRLGGHLGWFEASWESLLPQNRWFTKPVGEFIHTIAESHLSLPLESKEFYEDTHTGTPWHALPGPAVKDREIILNSKKANYLASLSSDPKEAVNPKEAVLNMWSLIQRPRHLIHLLIQDTKFKAALMGLVLLYFDKRIKSITVATFLLGALFSKKS